MSEVVESASSRRHRRNRRTAIVLVVLVAVLAGAFYYAASYFNKPSSGTASGCPTGDFTAGAAAPLKPSQVTVNVYNATTRAGLAASAAKDVKAQGFVVSAVSNDPLKKKIAGVGELRYGPNGDAAAALVTSTVVEGMTPVKDTRADASVDIVLGNAFQAVKAAPTPTPGAAAAASPC